MPSKSKRKGNAYERELVDTAKEAGLDAERAWGSDGRSRGWHEEVDCMIAGKKIQAKRRAKLASFLKPTEHVDAVAFREDRGSTYILLRFEDYLELL